MADLPQGWTIQVIGDVLEAKYGKALPELLRAAGNVPVFGSSGIVGSHSSSLTLGRTIVLGRKGSIGSVFLSEDPCWPIDTTYYIDSFGPLSSKFLYHFLRCARLGQHDRATAIPGLNRNDLYAVPVPIPPLNEQHRIAAKLEDLLARSRRAKDALDAIPPLLEKLRQSILAAAFRGDLTADWRAKNPDVEPAEELLKRIRIERRKKWEEAELAKLRAKGKAPTDERWKAKYKEPEPVDASELPELPDGWCWATVEELAATEPRSIQSGPFGSNLLHSEFQAEGILAIGIDNVLHGGFSPGAQNRISPEKFEELRKYSARPGDVLITVMATVGRCCCVPEDIEPAIITKHVYRITPDRLLVVPQFLMNAIRGARVVREALAEEERGQTRPGINGEILRSIPVPVAPLEEQHRLLAVLRETDNKLAAAQRTSRLLQDQLSRLEGSLLGAAFRGELVEQDPNDEPASVMLERLAAERESAQQAPAKAKRSPRQKTRA